MGVSPLAFLGLGCSVAGLSEVVVTALLHEQGWLVHTAPRASSSTGAQPQQALFLLLRLLLLTDVCSSARGPRHTTRLDLSTLASSTTSPLASRRTPPTLPPNFHAC